MGIKDETALAAKVEDLEGDVAYLDNENTFLTARAELAEEDAADGWRMAEHLLTFAKRGGDAEFVEDMKVVKARKLLADKRIKDRNP